MTIFPKSSSPYPACGGKPQNLLGRRYIVALLEAGVIVQSIVLRLKGIERIFVGTGVAVYEGAWLATEGTGELHIGNDVYIGTECICMPSTQSRLGTVAS